MVWHIAGPPTSHGGGRRHGRFSPVHACRSLGRFRAGCRSLSTSQDAGGQRNVVKCCEAVVCDMAMAGVIRVSIAGITSITGGIGGGAAIGHSPRSPSNVKSTAEKCDQTLNSHSGKPFENGDLWPVCNIYALKSGAGYVPYTTFSSTIEKWGVTYACQLPQNER
jgi:hypothetical protein